MLFLMTEFKQLLSHFVILLYSKLNLSSKTWAAPIVLYHNNCIYHNVIIFAVLFNPNDSFITSVDLNYFDSKVPLLYNAKTKARYSCNIVTKVTKTETKVA